MYVKEFLGAVERTFGIVGIPVAAAYVATTVVWQGRRRSDQFRDWWDGLVGRSPLRLSQNGRRNLVILLGLLAILGYIYCQYCGKSITEKAGHDASFFHILVTFSLRVYPYFIAGCILSAAIARIVQRNNRWLPKSMLGAGTFGAILPICSCAAAPFSYSLMMTKRIPIRAVVTFMMVAPVLNPFVVSFSWGVLGWRYTVLRIVSVFVLGMMTGVLVERFAGEREPDADGAAKFSCSGCSGGGSHFETRENVYDAAYALMGFLLPYIIVGVVVGAAFTLYLPPYVVGKYLSSGVAGLVLAAGIGLPIFLCSGEDVLILAPLMQMGLPMGHAIALTLAGNGICVSSIALLFPLFGKKATAWIIAAFFFGSLAIGFAINAASPLIG